MFASLTLLPALAMAMQIAIPLGPKPRHVERARAPIAEMGPAWAQECAGGDGGRGDWDKPAPPVRIHANTYYVGTCGIASILITGSGGHILIDGGTAKAPEMIVDSIRYLGFRPQDVKYILLTHEHDDHAGAIAGLQRLTGAMVLASPAQARVLLTGVAGGDDPQAGLSPPFPAVTPGGLIIDGQEIRLGDIMVKALATPGHTPGAMSYRWVSCDSICRTIVYADSLNPVSRDDYRFSDHPALVDAFRESLAKIATSECDILLTAHPSASGLDKRFAAGKPLLDPEACKDYAALRSKALDDRLAKEAEAPKAKP